MVLTYNTHTLYGELPKIEIIVLFITVMKVKLYCSMKLVCLMFIHSFNIYNNYSFMYKVFIIYFLNSYVFSVKKLNIKVVGLHRL